MSMLMFQRGAWSLMLHGQFFLSLEPATITQRRYPEPFQTGETAFGKQLIDGQNPHDFFMELAAEYVRKIGHANLYVYAAPAGDPALGSVAFPRRASTAELPQAPLTHHVLDSTHISYNVVTAGAIAGPVTIEGSAFHGHEPDERRWNIDGGKIDSWSSRLRLQPTDNLDLQASTADQLFAAAAPRLVAYHQGVGSGLQRSA
jgi:hypothetical protein